MKLADINLQEMLTFDPTAGRVLLGDDRMLIFRQDDPRRITNGFIRNFPAFSIEKLAWYEAPGFHKALLLSSVLVFLSAIIAALREMEQEGFAGTVGVVTPFRKQADRIRDRVTATFDEEVRARWQLLVPDQA